MRVSSGKACPRPQKPQALRGFTRRWLRREIGIGGAARTPMSEMHPLGLRKAVLEHSGGLDSKVR